MKRILTLACAAAVAFATLSACSNDPTVNGTQNTNGANLTFHQIDREGKSGIKVLYLTYSQHDPYNRNSPQNDGANYGPSISGFVTATAGRSAGIGTYVEDLLLPDALIANVYDTSPRASYLGWETGGQIATDCTGLPGATFGGRSLNDDLVSAMLGLSFSTLATSTTLKKPTPNVVSLSGGGVTPIPPDDGHDHNGQNGTANLSNQHVSCATKGFTSRTFPYLAPPV